MNLPSTRRKLEELNIFHSEIPVMNKPTVIGYDKKFKWSWMATQLNTFYVISDFGSDTVTEEVLSHHLATSFELAKKNYTGWPRGLQSGLGVVSILISDSITEEAKEYCRHLKSGKKWAGFAIPVAVDSNNGDAFNFWKNPMWGRIYFPYFKRMIQTLTEKTQSS
ncbi:MAG: hypothetical protein AAFP76_14905 [Bacteroidota bacterium]